jgi:alpha-tubulin suppressor-like RCC1 family protein
MVGDVVTEVVAGAVHTCALLSAGAVRCWGQGDLLGLASTEHVGDDESPASSELVQVGGRARRVATGPLSDHTCAVLDSGAVRCWGDGSVWQLGYSSQENIGDDEAPAQAGDVDVGGPVEDVRTGFQRTCALLRSGAVRCWGSGAFGGLGYGSTENVGDDETPADAGDVPLGARAVRLAVGSLHSCALLSSGTVRCWGIGADGELGYGNTENIGDDETPASAGDVDVGGAVVEIVAGGGHTCALLETGKVRCWGLGTSGQLGYADTKNVGDDETPAAAGDVDVGGPVVHLTAGTNHTCALLDSGGVRCWGSGGSGRLGYGNTRNVGDDELPASAGDVEVF